MLSNKGVESAQQESKFSEKWGFPSLLPFLPFFPPKLWWLCPNSCPEGQLSCSPQAVSAQLQPCHSLRPRTPWGGCPGQGHQQLNPLPPVLPMLLGMQPRTRVLSGPVQGDLSSDTYPHLSAQQSCIYRVCIRSSIGSLRSWPGSNTAEGSWNPLLGPLLQLLSCPKSSFLVPPGCDRLQGGRAE